MRRVLIVSCVFPPEPVVSAQLSYDIAHYIHKIGGKVLVLRPRPSRPLNYVFSEERGQLPFGQVTLNSYVCPDSRVSGRLRESISFGKKTYEYIKHYYSEIDVIYANTWPLFAQLYLALAAKKYGIPYFIHVQDIYPESFCHKVQKFFGRVLYGFLAPIDRYVLRNAKGVFAISPSMKLYLSRTRHIDLERITLVRNWQDDNAYIDAFSPIDQAYHKVNVMYLGSINPSANVSSIIRAISYLDSKKYQLSIIGDGPEKTHCQELARDLGLNVVFDSIMPDNVARKQSEAVILVLSLKKGVALTATPSKLTAYMLSGRPIIASVDLDSDCAGIIREADCGVVVEPENEHALSAAIEKLAESSPSILNKMGEAAYNYAIKHLSRDCNMKILVDQLLNG